MVETLSISRTCQEVISLNKERGEDCHCIIIAVTVVLHRQKKAGQRLSRPMSAPAISSLPGNRLSYHQAGADRKTGEKDVFRVEHNHRLIRHARAHGEPCQTFI